MSSYLIQPQLVILEIPCIAEIIEKWADKIIRMHRLTGGIRALMFGAKEGEKMRAELEKFRRRVCMYVESSAIQKLHGLL